MNNEEACAILDALAAGCSPFTGELLDDHPVLNDRKVIRALQMALNALAGGAPAQKWEQPKEAAPIALEQEAIVAVLQLMKEASIEPSYSKVTKFFLGSRHFINTKLAQSNLYGLLKNQHTYNSLKPILVGFFEENPTLVASYQQARSDARPWDTVLYFRQDKFCKLSEKALKQLKEKITALGILKTPPDLNETIIQARKVHPRAYEPWSDKEMEYLSKAIFYTNNLSILSTCFGRTESSLESVGKRLIFKGQASVPGQGNKQ